MRSCFAALLLLLALGACYDTPRPDCAFECGPDGACPEGYSCQDVTGWCKLDDAPEALECSPSLVEADEDVDAGMPDASE